MPEANAEISVSLAQPFWRGLACAALQPGLRSVLLFDASAPVFEAASVFWQSALSLVSGKPVETITLSPSVAEDDLWGIPVLQGPTGPGAQNPAALLAWKKGLLVGNEKDETLKIVLIPDLARLNLSAARACVMLVDAAVVHLERNSRHASWRPNLCWLAGCSRQAIGQVSPHLLDRFAVRLQAPAAPHADPLKALLSWLAEPSSSSQAPGSIPILSPAARRQFTQAAHSQPPFSSAAILEVVASFESLPHPGCRREIALARLAQANAQLEGASSVGRQHVAMAARLMGIKPAAPEPEPLSVEEQEDLQAQTEPDSLPPQAGDSPSAELPGAGLLEQAGSAVEQEVIDSGTPALALSSESGFDLPAWPEDSAPVAREIASLRLPVHSRGKSIPGRGLAVGVQRANNLHDLALASTLLEAAKFQAVRRKHQPEKRDAFLLSVADLCSYRRLPIPEQMLVLLLDYTCLRHCNWQAALLPFLRWAYQERAAVCIVQVGAANARNELRASLVYAHSVLSPLVAAAFDCLPGQATPLAHGFFLVRQVLQKALQQGRYPIYQARLVVLTDGRGNVPLDASQAGSLAVSVSRKGVDDALSIAAGLKALKHLQITLLDPQPALGAGLLLQLAGSMGAGRVRVPLLDGARAG